MQLRSLAFCQAGSALLSTHGLCRGREGIWSILTEQGDPLLLQALLSLSGVLWKGMG